MGVIQTILDLVFGGTTKVDGAYMRSDAETAANEGNKRTGNSKKTGNRGGGTADYFVSVIREMIPEVEPRETVRLSEITAEDPGKKVDIDVLIYKDGQPCVAIILVPKDKYRNLCYVNTMECCERAGVKALRFMQEFQNVPEYVAERITDALK